MLKTLLKIQLEALKHGFTSSIVAKSKGKKKGKGAIIGMIALFVYCAAAFGFLFLSLFHTMAEPFHTLGLDWFYFAMMAMMSLALMVVGSVFMAKTQIYESKDNEFLLSLPIKPGNILLARLLALALITFAFNLIVFVPGFAVWASAGYFTAASLVACLVGFLFLPFLALALTSLLAWLLSLLSSKTGKNSIVTLIFSLIFFGAYMYLVSTMNNLVAALAMNPDPAAQAVGAIKPLYALCQAIAQGNIARILIYAALMLLRFAAVYFVLEKTFIKIATMRTANAKKKYVEKKAELSSPQKALLRKESARFFSSATFMLNSGMGIIMMIVGAGALVICRDSLVSSPAYEMLEQMITGFMPIMLCFMAAMTLVSAASISLEGKSIWVLKSLPLDTKDILKSKLKFQLLLSVPPMIIAVLAMAYVVRPGLIDFALQLALPLAFTVFVGLFGLMMNLKRPRLDWTNEAQIIKNSMSVVVTMFACWGALIVPAVCIALLAQVIAVQIIQLIFLVLVLAAIVLIYRWVMSEGVRVFDGL